VSENDHRHSGSRWEPAPSPSAEPAASAPAPPAAAGQATEAAPGLSARPRRRGLMAAAAVGLAVLGGLGGFGLGQAVARNESTGSGLVGTGFPGGDDGYEDDFPGQRPDLGDDRVIPPGDDDGIGQGIPELDDDDGDSASIGADSAVGGGIQGNAST
jgi:hypothetical protein